MCRAETQGRCYGAFRIAAVVSRVHSFILQGIDATPCEIEADLSTAQLPKTTIVGLPDAAVKESVQR
ncbi:MAG: hypothetical protein ACYS0G_08845, partial [Planctomycetota bacterium]